MRSTRRPEPVFFDLDGTIAESAGGIIASLEHAFAECGVERTSLDWTRIIGPPLPQMLDEALPGLSSECRDKLIAAYRRHYTQIGMFLTTAFHGIMELLQYLSANKNSVYIVTNKPQAAAEAIIAHLRLDKFVTRVVGGDPTGAETKPTRAAALVREECLTAGVFIGDGLDDLHAAERVGFQFFLAGWGYGAAKVLDERPNVAVLNEPSALIGRAFYYQ